MTIGYNNRFQLLPTVRPHRMRQRPPLVAKDRPGRFLVDEEQKEQRTKRGDIGMAKQAEVTIEAIRYY